MENIIFELCENGEDKGMYTIKCGVCSKTIYLMAPDNKEYTENNKELLTEMAAKHHKKDDACEKEIMKNVLNQGEELKEPLTYSTLNKWKKEAEENMKKLDLLKEEIENMKKIC